MDELPDQVEHAEQSVTFGGSYVQDDLLCDLYRLSEDDTCHPSIRRYRSEFQYRICSQHDHGALL